MPQPSDIQLPDFVDILDDIAAFFDGDLVQANSQRPDWIRPFQNWRDVYFYVQIAPPDSAWRMLHELVPEFFWAS